MPIVPGPGDPGYSHDVFMGHLINVGLREARTVGLGLPLVNELQSRFPDVDRTIIGSAAGIVGQGVRAAVGNRSLAPGEIPDLANVPVIPNVFFKGAEQDRLLYRSDVDWSSGVGRAANVWSIDFTGAEDLSWDVVIDEIANRLIEEKEETDPKAAQSAAVEQVNIFFMGRRF